jgi:hypothetical protein
VPRHQKDLEDVYRSEKSRGRRQVKTPEDIEAQRLLDEIVAAIRAGCTRNRFISILQRYELSAERLREYLEKFDRLDRPGQ